MVVIVISGGGNTLYAHLGGDFTRGDGTGGKFSPACKSWGFVSV